MNDIAQKMYTEMEEELALIHDLGDLPVKRLSAALSVIKGYTTKLNDILAAHTFASPQAEIEYFKHWKPRFQAERVYALEKYALEISQPSTDSRALRIYY
ncbi:MAG: hypothetical protein EOP50_15475, partial [Sphingobacteriales bacterium]